MELSLVSFQALLFSLLLFFFLSPATAQSSNTNVADFSCSTSCDTYLIYRTQSPNFLDPGNVSDLFEVSRLSIKIASNLPSEEVILLPNQLLLVPISCGCTGNQSFANITYQIKSGDSFYLVSINAFENLTDYHVVEALNPTLEPTKLKVGQEVIFPIYCKCPTKTQLDQGLNFFITYVWQLGDDISALSKMMNTSAEAIATANNYRNLSDAVDLPILIPVLILPRLPPQLYYNTTPSLCKESSKSSSAFIITSSLLGALLALLLLSFLVFAYSKRDPKKGLAGMNSSLDTVDLLKSQQPSSCDQNLSPKAIADKLLPGVREYIDKPVVFETKAIMEATMNLVERFRLGGSVYRATLNGEVFAVKRGKGDVTEELKILRKVNHANLVKLAGVSTEIDGDFFLVYEFAENGSLDKWLYPKTQSSSSVGFLSWKQRLTIALDVANGLQYMHEHTRPSIVHRDIRTSNILLNANFKAKISNFSMAKPASISVTPMIDVFAFGIVLLELLSGRRVMSTREGGEIGLLWKEIRMVLEVEEKVEERLKKWMDSSLDGFYPTDGALSLAAMAKACTSEVASERPSMAEIVFSLSVLAHSYSGEFERRPNSHSEENIQIIKPVVAR